MTAARRTRERLVDLPFRLRARLARSERLRRLVYELRNRRLFADFFQHDRMLADEVRTEAYWRAAEKHISAGDHVIDLGTGSGVLALFAASQGAQVHAIEHGPIVEAAKAVAADNGITNVEFHRLNSRQFTLDRQVDVIVHEQIGDALFDEKMVGNIADLRDRLLKPGGRIYPSRFRMYFEPVQLQAGMRAPFAWQQKLHGIDFKALERFSDGQRHDYLYRLFRPFPFDRFLCQPEPVLEIDLHTANEGDLPRRISFERAAVSEGLLAGYCVYFDAIFDDEIQFTSSPAEIGTNWATPLLRVAQRQVAPGDVLRFELAAGDLADPASWTWTG